MLIRSSAGLATETLSFLTCTESAAILPPQLWIKNSGEQTGGRASQQAVKNPPRLPSGELIFRVRDVNKLSAVWLSRRSVPASQFPCRSLIKLRAQKFFQDNENVFCKKRKGEKTMQWTRKETSLKCRVKLDFGKCRLVFPSFFFFFYGTLSLSASPNRPLSVMWPETPWRGGGTS